MFMYCSTIHFLINNFDNKDRAQLAFDEAEKMLSTFSSYNNRGTEVNMSDWLKISK